MQRVDNEDLRAVFRTFDLNGDGFISVVEFKEVMRKFGKDMGDDEIKHVIKTFDDDANGLVCFNEL